MLNINLVRQQLSHQHYTRNKTLLIGGLITYLAVHWWLVLTGRVLTDPVQHLLDMSGNLALQLLIATFLLSALSRRLTLSSLLRYRRLTGLAAWAVSGSHILVYCVFELGLEWTQLIMELQDRQYIILGAIAFLILSILSLTSIHRIRRMLKRKWYLVHRLSYLAFLLIGIHYLMAVKAVSLEPLVYIALGTALIVLNLRDHRNRQNGV